MLKIIVPSKELFIEKTETFENTKETQLSLEHSLVSVSKWESKWHKPFLNNIDKTNDEIIDYIKCMTLTQNINDNIYQALSGKNINDIKEYIENPMTATWFMKTKNSAQNRIVTNELIYYWMITLNIPMECQKWHLNRLLTLIQVCNSENAPKEMRNPNDILRENAAINAARKKQFNTKG